MNRLTSGLAIGTIALFTATGFALAQSAPDAAGSGSPPASPASPAPAETTAPSESPAPSSTQQMTPSDEPAQAGGMHNTSDQSSGKKPCEPTTQSSSTDAAKASAGCRKPK